MDNLQNCSICEYFFMLFTKNPKPKNLHPHHIKENELKLLHKKYDKYKNIKH